MTAGVPIRCSELPLDFDLDQPTAQLCAITLALAIDSLTGAITVDGWIGPVQCRGT